MNWTTNPRTLPRAPILPKLATIALLLLTPLALPKPAHAGTLGSDVIAMFPKNVGEFGYADLRTARNLKWFPQLRDQVLPERFRQFEKFLVSTGNDPNTQVDEIAWALVAEGLSAKAEGTGSDAVPTGEQMVGVALGNFNPDSTAAYFKQQKLPTSDFHGYTFYSFGSGSGASDLSFVFIDSGTAVYGQKSILKKMISVRFGDEDGLMRNDKFFALINEANTGSAVWLVTNPAYTRLAVRQLAPEIEQFPEAAKLVTRMQNSIINIDAGSELDAKVQAVCGSTDDANTLGQLLQAGFLYKRYQAQKDNPDLADLLNQVTITPGGDRVTLTMSVSDDQMTSLLKHNTFALKM
ncbi:MAG TPA: hypothetical protein VJN93_07430 [Candidatus Acidoferrum sp.]|nr:hypothetical protein [Candidatus Acidoferrum sp.]